MSEKNIQVINFTSFSNLSCDLKLFLISLNILEFSKLRNQRFLALENFSFSQALKTPLLFLRLPMNDDPERVSEGQWLSI